MRATRIQKLSWAAYHRYRGYWMRYLKKGRDIHVMRDGEPIIILLGEPREEVPDAIAARGWRPSGKVLMTISARPTTS